MIPEEAIEAAARKLADLNSDEGDQLTDKEWARELLEAAAPHLLAHEREQTRLAHLDAMVNRETKQTELATAWDEGHECGLVNAVSIEPGPGSNPYRKA